jgi:hypothetical protein
VEGQQLAWVVRGRPAQKGGSLRVLAVQGVLLLREVMGVRAAAWEMLVLQQTRAVPVVVVVLVLVVLPLCSLPVQWAMQGRRFRAQRAGSLAGLGRAWGRGQILRLAGLCWMVLLAGWLGLMTLS